MSIQKIGVIGVGTMDFKHRALDAAQTAKTMVNPNFFSRSFPMFMAHHASVSWYARASQPSMSKARRAARVHLTCMTTHLHLLQIYPSLRSSPQHMSLRISLCR